MNEKFELTPGLQCCLRCGRVLTNRTLHDAMEEPVLASIRESHPGAADPGEPCQPCIEEYRNLLNARQTRSGRLREEPVGQRPSWVNRWLAGRVNAGQAL